MAGARRPPWTRPLLAFLVGSLTIAFAGSADGHPSRRWVYEAPAECPSKAELERMLHQRVTASSLARDPRRFAIQITRTEQGFVGRLTVSGESESEGEERRDGSERGGALSVGGNDQVPQRVVEEETCAATVEALIVFTAIALAPAEAAMTEPREPSHAPAMLPPKPAPPRSAEAPSSDGRRLPALLGFAGGAGMTTGPAPGPAPVVTLAAAIHQPFTERRGLAMRLGAKAAWGDKDVSTGELDAQLVAGTAEIAPTFSWGSLSIAAGPALTVGVLSARGQEIARGRQSNHLWADLGAVLRGGVRTGGVRFEAYAAGGAALTPRTYTVERPAGERDVHTTPPVALTVGGEVVIELGRGL